MDAFLHKISSACTNDMLQAGERLAAAFLQCCKRGSKCILQDKNVNFTIPPVPIRAKLCIMLIPFRKEGLGCLQYHLCTYLSFKIAKHKFLHALSAQLLRVVASKHDSCGDGGVSLENMKR